MFSVNILIAIFRNLQLIMYRKIWDTFHIPVGKQAFSMGADIAKANKITQNLL